MRYLKPFVRSAFSTSLIPYSLQVLERIIIVLGASSRILLRRWILVLSSHILPMCRSGTSLSVRRDGGVLSWFKTPSMSRNKNGPVFFFILVITLNPYKAFRCSIQAPDVTPFERCMSLRQNYPEVLRPRRPHRNTCRNSNRTKRNTRPGMNGV